MMVGRYPNLKEEVCNSIHDYEISSLLDIQLARWSSCFLCFGVGMSAFYLKNTNKIKMLEV
jgi:hypothetical protein